MSLSFYNNQGLTVIEVLVAVAIVAILGGMALTSFTASRNVRDLTSMEQNVLSVFRLAQARTLAGENNSAWGVHLESNQVVLFQGDIYASSPLTQAYPLVSSIELTGISLNGGGNDVIFKRVTGETDQAGTFVLNVVTAPSTSRSIIVDRSGNVYETASFPPPAVTRAMDLRHRAFTLGWSIKTASTLTLTFADPPNPDTVISVAMAPFFDPGPTKFDWSGTMVISGSDQTLRIHTTSLTDTDTVLSIDRDCRKNNKKLIISIDGKTIATYEADCATITIGAFGGTMVEP